MTLRVKLVMLTCLMFAAACAMMFMVSQTILMTRFEELEEKDTTRNVQRAVSALYGDFSTVSIEFSSLMLEREAFAMVQDGEEMYMKMVVSQPTFDTLGVNYILFVTSPRTPPQGMGFDLETGEALPIPATLVRELTTGDCPLSQPPAVSDSSVTGILALQDNTLLVQSYPLVADTDFGPLEGRVLFVRFLDDTEIARLAEQTHLSLSLTRLDNPDMPGDFREVEAVLSVEAPTVVSPLNSDSAAGYGLLTDIYGDPALIMKAEVPRDIYREGQTTVIWLMVFLMTVSVVFALVTILLINRLLLARLFTVSSSISKIRGSGDLSKRVPEHGKDELSDLGANINGMLSSLQQSQREFLQSEAQNTALVNAIPDTMFRMNKNGVLLDAKAIGRGNKKPGLRRHSHVDRKPSIEYEMLSIEVEQRGLPHVLRALETGETQVFEFPLTFDHTATNYEARVAISGRDEALIMVRNITERREVEDARKKEVLLKEIHHRVKNNLQVISSLLYLQSKRVDDQRLMEMFNESSNRIKSMSLIHQKLYQSQNAATVDFAEYIRDLTDALFTSYGVRRDMVRLTQQIDGIILNVDTAIPCGLIVNELVSNSLKYAFPDGKQGQIVVTMRKDGGGRFTLVVSDTGIGLPRDFDHRESPSLGLKLVHSLVEQLGGTIEVYRQGGTEFRITFREIKQQPPGGNGDAVVASQAAAGGR
ncbi:MAG: HAMP domain-containing protein [Chloroflexi bacterium]|nr:HAMP domain-containing protein [Chloroflexota bacterium]